MAYLSITRSNEKIILTANDIFKVRTLRESLEAHKSLSTQMIAVKGQYSSVQDKSVCFSECYCSKYFDSRLPFGSLSSFNQVAFRKQTNHLIYRNVTLQITSHV